KDDCLLIAEFTKFSTPLNPQKPHIVLVNPSDAGNLGTIMRSATAFGFEDIAIITPAVDNFAPKSIRASMGAAFHLNIASFPSIEAYRKAFSSRPLLAFMLNNTAQQLSEAAQTAPDCYSLVFGNEASGLPAEFADFCTPVFIPQSESVDSLNLSVAASIALFTFRQI
ncbi:TrmH family RNA methyltransferase, partial [Candidatus Saccharibacteria bacterium]|nr:TrmH family RNA methyltransferase [Candidatus Saccharibacteria bacterium]